MIAPCAGELRTLAQADVLLLIARLLGRPSDSTRAALEATDEELRELAEFADLGGPDALSSLAAAVGEARDLDETRWGGEHSRLFEGAVTCPINETAYVRRDKGAILADICGFYEAFGFRLSGNSGEKADHLVTELEFLALLLVMLSQARKHHDEGDQQVTLAALRTFAGEHLDEWLALFCQRLETTTDLGFYRRVASSLRQAAETVFADHGVPRAEVGRADFPVDDPGTPYECGKAITDTPPKLLDIR